MTHKKQCHQQGCAEFNKAICDLKCRINKRSCPDYNRNLILAERDDNGLPLLVLERPCPRSWKDGRSYNEEHYDPAAQEIRCKECPEVQSCRRVLSPKMVTSPFLNEKGQPELQYSEFSGCTVVVAPNYLTFDLKQNNPGAESLYAVQTIQFLLWDNRGCDKREACDVTINYRLMVSDHEGDLCCNERDEVVSADGSEVRWQVLYDTLREGQNGWQVFHLNRPMRIRYIRLHLISSGDEKRRCNIVRLGAYSQPLVGYPYYNYLPHLERVIELPEPLAIGPATPCESQEVVENPITKFPEELRRQIEARRSEKEQLLARSSFPYMEELQIELLKDFAADLDIAIRDLRQHDRRVSRVKQRVYGNTNKIMRKSKFIKWASISVTALGLLIAIIELLR